MGKSVLTPLLARQKRPDFSCLCRMADRDNFLNYEGLRIDGQMKKGYEEARYPSVFFRIHQEAVLETAKSNFCEVEMLKPVIGIFIFVPD
jgi:hypothetical protein